MLNAVDYVVRRGLNDARLLGDTSELEEEWEETRRKIRKGRARTLDAFCGLAERTVAQTPESDRRFLTPGRLLGRTRLAVRLIGEMEKRKKPAEREEDDLETLAAAVGAQVLEVRDALAGLFLVPEPSLDHLRALCRPDEKKKIGAVDLADRYGIGEALMFSLEKGRLPDQREAREFFGITRAELIKKVQNGLTDDLEAAVAPFISAGFSANDTVLNRYSYYFREYGTRVYWLWFDGDLSALLRRFPAEVKKRLELSFSRSNHLFRDEFEIRWRRSTGDLVSRLEELENPREAMSLLESHFEFRFSDRVRQRFNPNAARRLIGFFHEHDIPCVHNQLWFIYARESIDRLLEQYSLLLSACRRLALPLKTRVKLFQVPKYESAEKQIAFFENLGLSSEYYLPYLGVSSKSARLAARRITGMVCAERRMRETKRVTQKGRVMHIPDVTQDHVEALSYLRGIGFPYDASFPDAARVIHSPEAYARRARVAEGIPRPAMSARLLSRPISWIREHRGVLMTGRIKGAGAIDYHSNEFEEMMAERGLTPPDWAIDFGKVRVVERIRYIELKGVPFTRENMNARHVHWSWINLSPRELERKIARKKTRINRRSRFAELGGLYGFDYEDIPIGVLQKTPGHAWRYLMVLDAAGMALEDRREGIHLNALNMYGLARFKDELAYRLKAKKTAGETLTEKQELYLARYSWADRAASAFGWNDAHDFCHMMTKKDLSNVQGFFEEEPSTRKQKGTAEKWRRFLRERMKKHERILAAMEHMDGSYAAKEAVMDLYSVEELEGMLD